MWPSGVWADAEPMPPLRLTVVAPVPAPTLPSAKSPGGRGSGRVAKFAIGRVATPVLVAAAQEIEQNGGGHDRHPRAAHGEAAALFPQPRLHPGRRVETECRAAGQRDGVDALDRLRRVEQRGFAGARSAAAQVHRGDGGPSNTMAVAPEPSRKSCAWPTMIPGTSVMRLRTLWLPSCRVQGARPGIRRLQISDDSTRRHAWREMVVD